MTFLISTISQQPGQYQTSVQGQGSDNFLQNEHAASLLRWSGFEGLAPPPHPLGIYSARLVHLPLVGQEWAARRLKEGRRVSSP